MATFFIYKISINNMSYIGSAESISKKMSYHKSGCNNENYKSYNTKLHKYIRSNGGWNNVNVQILDVVFEEHRRDKTLVKQLMKHFTEYFKSELSTYSPYISEEKKIEKLKNIEKKKKIQKIYNKEIVYCPHCNKEMKRGSLSDHITKHARKAFYNLYDVERLICFHCKKELKRGVLISEIKKHILKKCHR